MGWRLAVGSLPQHLQYPREHRRGRRYARVRTSMATAPNPATAQPTMPVSPAIRTMRKWRNCANKARRGCSRQLEHHALNGRTESKPSGNNVSKVLEELYAQPRERKSRQRGTHQHYAGEGRGEQQHTAGLNRELLLKPANCFERQRDHVSGQPKCTRQRENWEYLGCRPPRWTQDDVRSRAANRG